MNKFLTGTIAVIGVAAAVPALAADMAPRYSKAPMAPPPIVYNWTGCYIGGNVGGGWARTDQVQVAKVGGPAIIPNNNFGTSDSNGNFIGGGQIGCDYQFAGNWVVGIQGMFDFGNTNSSNIVPDPRVTAAIGPATTTTRTRDLYTVTGRIGYLFTPQLLGYVKGGGAWTRTYTELRGTPPALSESASADRQGYTVGGGLEYMFAPGWSVFGEYNYADFGRKDIVFTPGPGTIGAASITSTRLDIQTALVGVNYKFNWAQPVVAKY
jgi:outer membrane immunogenic protein